MSNGDSYGDAADDDDNDDNSGGDAHESPGRSLLSVLRMEQPQTDLHSHRSRIYG